MAARFHLELHVMSSYGYGWAIEATRSGRRRCQVTSYEFWRDFQPRRDIKDTYHSQSGPPNAESGTLTRRSPFATTYGLLSLLSSRRYGNIGTRWRRRYRTCKRVKRARRAANQKLSKEDEALHPAVLLGAEIMSALKFSKFVKRAGE